MKTFTYLLLLSILMLQGCSPEYIYYSQSLSEKQKWTQDDLMRIQFFVSEDIVLSRSIDEGKTLIEEGRIRIKNGKRVEQVVIKAGTPGVLIMMPAEDRYAISFEENDSQAYLMFGPNPGYYNRFALLAQDWEQESGQVHYRNNVYTVDASSAYSSLMVDLKNEGGSQYVNRKVEGRIVKE